MTRFLVQLGDGGVMSVVFGTSAYSCPREQDHSSTAFTQVEIGMWTKPSEALEPYAELGVKPEGDLTVYPYVPVEVMAQEILNRAKK